MSYDVAQVEPGDGWINMRLDDSLVASLPLLRALDRSTIKRIEFEDKKLSSRSIKNFTVDVVDLFDACHEILLNAPRRQSTREDRITWSREQLEAMRATGQVAIPPDLTLSQSRSAQLIVELFLHDEHHTEHCVEMFATYAHATILSHDYVTHRLDAYFAPLVERALKAASNSKRKFRKSEITNYAGLIAETLADLLPGVIPTTRERTRLGVQKRRCERTARLKAAGSIE